MINKQQRDILIAIAKTFLKDVAIALVCLVAALFIALLAIQILINVNYLRQEDGIVVLLVIPLIIAPFFLFFLWRLFKSALLALRVIHA